MYHGNKFLCHGKLRTKTFLGNREFCKPLFTGEGNTIYCRAHKWVENLTRIFFVLAIDNTSL